YLKGTSGYKESENPATINIPVNKDGHWRLLSLAREYTTYVGGRYFDVQIGSYPRQRLGVHGKNGWAWEASQPFPMFSGDYELKLIDASGNYARLAMLVLTDDPDFMPEDSIRAFEFLKENTYKDGMYTAPEKSKTPDSDRPATDIAVKLNGSYLNFDVEPQIMNGRTMVPFRAIFETLGCAVEWNADARVAKGIRNGKAVRLTIDSKTATVDGVATTLDQEAVIVGGRTMVPLRFVSEALGAAVDWNADTRTVSIMAKIPEQVYWFDTESFTNLGSWNLSQELGSLSKNVFISRTDAVLPTDGKPKENEPATTTFSVAEEGDYYVWVRGKDYATNQPGTRFFNVAVNGSMIEEKFGTHGVDGYRWVKAKNKVHLKKGENSFEVHDTSDFWARFDCAVITKSESFVPEENLTSMQTVASPLRETNDALLAFPAYASENGVPTDSVTIENGKTKVVFYKVPTSKGQVVQNEIYAKDASGNFVLTKARNEELGFFALKADTASWKRLADTATFTTTYSTASGTKSFYGSNPYQAGNGEWFVPTDYTVDNNTVNLIFADGSYSKLSASYTLEQDNESPKVSVKLTAPADGYYTIAAWEGGSFANSDFTDAVAPYRVIKKRVHADVCAIPEQYMFTPMGTYTLAENNKYGTAPITKGIVLDPDWMPRNWAHEYDGHFAINMRTPDSNYRATVFSPILGSSDSKLAKDQTYTLEYRVVSRVSDWFDSYKYIIKDLYDVTDYRQNTYATLNEAIFNTRKLMLDDFYAGWDANAIGYYNIEAMNTATDANPMQAVQDYLLSDNEEFLERRAIPHMAALLTRPGLHINPTTKAYGVLTGWGATFEKDYDPIGSPRSGYNLNVFGGIYEMTRGNTPAMYDVGLQKGAAGVVNAYGNIAPFSNNLNMYLYTGEQKYLDEAIKQADTYLTEKVYIDHEKFDLN
ncbi:MAG: copper amine oxidase N-terminal domain-containing protein, partial [Clostridia bacterium]|nr:copper amine oxidase N-terminal domain-containing protein [Clostridia bacterium]